MQKPLTYALLLAVTLGLAACDKTPEEKTESAPAAAPEAVQPQGDAAQEPSAPAADPTLNPPPTSDEPSQQ
ncbi:MAG: hypothetical protein ACRERY_19225 [Pseudomonas sp.]